MPRPAVIIFDNFRGHLLNTEHTRRKCENLFREGFLVRRDLEVLYRGLFLEIITSFEKFLEQLFIGLLSNSIFHSSKRVIARVNFRSIQTCRDIINGERSYVDGYHMKDSHKKEQKDILDRDFHLLFLQVLKKII